MCAIECGLVPHQIKKCATEQIKEYGKWTSLSLVIMISAYDVSITTSQYVILK